MGEQQSQKHGLRSSAQKEARARDAYAPIPPSNPVGGAFGEPKPDTPSDEDLSLSIDEKRLGNELPKNNRSRRSSKVTLNE